MVIDQTAMVANAIVAEDAVVADAVVAAEAKAGIVKEDRRAEDLRASAVRLLGQKTRLLRKPRLCRRVTVPIAMKTLAMRTQGIIRLPKRFESGSMTIVHRRNRNSGRPNRSTRRRNLSTGSRHHNM